MKFSGIFKGKEARNEEKTEKKKEKEQKLDELLDATAIKLRLIYEKNEILLEKELNLARGYQKKGIKNQDNYAKIGIIYYSMKLTARAQERIKEMRSSRDIYNCMQSLGEALEALNKINGKMGRLPAGWVISGIETMTGSEGKSSGNLKKTSEKLGRAEKKQPGEERKNTGVDGLMDVDLIERLINGSDVDNCVRSDEGITSSGMTGLDNFSEVADILSRLSEEAVPEADVEDTDMDRMKELLDKM